DDVARSRTPLVEGRTGQARPADHIARCVDVGHLGAIVLIHRQLTATVGLQADIFQSQPVSIAGTAVAPEEGVSLDLFARLQMQHHATILESLDLLVLLVVTNQRHVGAQMVTEGIGDLVIEEAQQPVAVVDEVDLHPQTTEDRGVFATDHPRTVDDQRPRRVIELEDGVAVIDARWVEIDIRRAVGPRAGGDDDFPGYQAIHGTVGVDQFDGIGVGKTALAVEQIDTVARVVTVAGPDLQVDHRLGALENVGEGKVPGLGDHPKHGVGVELDDLDDFPGYQAIHGTVGVDQFDGIGVGKTALAVEQIDTVARVVTVAGPDLQVDHRLGALENVGEGKVPGLGDHPKHGVGVELDD